MKAKKRREEEEEEKKVWKLGICMVLVMNISLFQFKGLFRDFILTLAFLRVGLVKP